MKRRAGAGYLHFKAKKAWMDERLVAR